MRSIGARPFFFPPRPLTRALAKRRRARSILYQRGIYPPEEFKRVAKYGLSMMVTSDEGLQKRVSRRFCSFLPRSAAGPGVGAGT